MAGALLARGGPADPDNAPRVPPGAAGAGAFRHGPVLVLAVQGFGVCADAAGDVKGGAEEHPAKWC